MGRDTFSVSWQHRGGGPLKVDAKKPMSDLAKVIFLGLRWFPWGSYEICLKPEFVFVYTSKAISRRYFSDILEKWLVLPGFSVKHFFFATVTDV